jgi:hypothetical protein
MLPRPTNRELCNKVAEALDAIKAGRFTIGVTKHLSGDLAKLELESGADLPKLLLELLGEIQNVGPIECYAGTRPPQRSYEPEIQNLELWAYCWYSERLGREMYLKFALKKQMYIYVDCHASRSPEEMEL